MWWQYIFSCGHPADISKSNPIKRPAASIRGHLVRSYNANIEDDYYLDREHELGKGGCGVVVVGEHKQTRGQYAIKIINKSTAERGRLDRELKLMKDVDHANIVRLFSVYDTPSHMYFVMELCLGGHLGNLLSRQPNKCVDEEWAKRLCRQLLSAVAHIHSRGIAHRDIKLQNILIDSTIDKYAQLKLIDFGYGSRFLGALPMKTKCGTPYTTAPEVIRECYDQRCDVWSCGVVLYIMLCGRRPFEAIDVNGPLSDAGKAAMITNILAGRYHFNHRQWQNVSRAGINFVKALLTQDYRHRMHSHEALESPWLKDTQVIANQSKMLSSEKGARALSKLKQSTDHNEFQRAGMVALVFGIPSRAAADLRAVFQSFDVDSSGTLSRKEFQGALHRLAPELTNEDIERLFDIVDIDKNQQISYTEFLVATLDPRDVDIEELNKAFRLLDEDGNGFITRDEMRKVVKQMLQQQLENSNEKASDLLQLSARPLHNANSTGDYLDDLVEQRLETIFAQVDKDNDGYISHSEFVWAMTGMDPALFDNDQEDNVAAANNTNANSNVSNKRSKNNNSSGRDSPAAPVLGKLSSGYFHTSDRFSRRPNAESSVKNLNALSFKGNNHTMAVTEVPDNNSSMRRTGSNVTAALPPRQTSLRNVAISDNNNRNSFSNSTSIDTSNTNGNSLNNGNVRRSFRGPLQSQQSLLVQQRAQQNVIVEESTSHTGHGNNSSISQSISGRGSSIRHLPVDNSYSDRPTLTSSGRGLSRKQLSVGLPSGTHNNIMEDVSQTEETQQDTLVQNSSAKVQLVGNVSPLPQYKGMLARSQKAILDDRDNLNTLSNGNNNNKTQYGNNNLMTHGDTGMSSPRTSVNLRGNSGSLAVTSLQDELDMMPGGGLDSGHMNLQSYSVEEYEGQYHDIRYHSSTNINTSPTRQSFSKQANKYIDQDRCVDEEVGEGEHNSSGQDQDNMSSSSYNTQIVAQLFGPPPSTVHTSSKQSLPHNLHIGSNSNQGSEKVVVSHTPSVAVTPTRRSKILVNNNSLLGIVQEQDSCSESVTDGRRNSLNSVNPATTSNISSKITLPPLGQSVIGSGVQHSSASHDTFSVNLNNNNSVSNGLSRSRSSSQRNSSSQVPVVCHDQQDTLPYHRFTDVLSSPVDEGMGNNVPGPPLSTISGASVTNTPKLTRLGSKFAGSFKRDVSSKYLVDDSDEPFEDNRLDKEHLSSIVPPLSRLNSRNSRVGGVSLSGRSQRDFDITNNSSEANDAIQSGLNSNNNAVPMMTSPSFLANIKRMISSNNIN